MTKVLTTNISMQEKLITLKGLAALFSLSEGSIYKLVDCRKINFYKIGGVLRFKQSDVDKYLQEVLVEQVKI